MINTFALDIELLLTTKHYMKYENEVGILNSQNSAIGRSLQAAPRIGAQPATSDFSRRGDNLPQNLPGQWVRVSSSCPFFRAMDE